MNEHVENAPAEGVNPQSQAQEPITQEQVTVNPEGTGSQDTPQSDDTGSQVRGEPSAGSDGNETDARPPSRARDRIQELIEQRKASDAKAEYWKLQAQRTQVQPAGDETAYPDDASWRKAIVQESIQEARRASAEASAQEAAEQAFQARAQAFETRVGEFRERAPDFDTVARNPNLPITPVMGEAITESDVGPQVAYWLGKNPSDAHRIASLPPVRQVAEIGRIEARLTAQPTAKKTTAAPPPPHTISGSPSPVAANPESMDLETYKKWRRGQQG